MEQSRATFLFPGQGAQFQGMGKDLWEASPKVKELFEKASDITAMDLRRLLFEGSEEELKATGDTLNPSGEAELPTKGDNP